MLAYDTTSIIQVLVKAVLNVGHHKGPYTCPYCGLNDLTHEELWHHCPAFHVNWPNSVYVTENCPICSMKLGKLPLQVHLHEHHVPPSIAASRMEEVIEKGSGVTQLYNFSLVICRNPLNNKYLLCQEFADQGG